IRLPRLQPRFKNALPKLPRIDFAYGLPVLWASQGEGRSGAHGLHEFVGDVDAMVQIEALAVEVSRGFADFQELLDFRVMDVEIDRCRTAPQRALADGKCQAIHDVNERNDARGNASSHFLADGTHTAPVGADAAAIRCEPDVFVPRADNSFQRVGHGVQEAG